MTTPNNPTTPVGEPNSAGNVDRHDPVAVDPHHDPAEPHAGDPDDDTTSGPPNKERQYRLRAQRAEAERDELRVQLDTLTAEVTNMRQAVVDETASATGLRNPALLSAEHALEDFLTDDGTVDRTLVTEAVHATMEKNGIPRHVGIRPNPGQGFTLGNGGGGRRPAGGWRDAIKDAGTR